MTRTFLILALVLSGCARTSPPGPGTYRSASVPISSIALFEQSRLDGDWTDVAGYPLRSNCRPGAAVRFADRGTALVGDACHLPPGTAGKLVPAGPGRFRSGGVELWVLWVDADYRTLVLGSPSGRFAAILNRGGAIPPDRLTAARRVLDFNGYDPARLEVAG